MSEASAYSVSVLGALEGSAGTEIVGETDGNVDLEHQ